MLFDTCYNGVAGLAHAALVSQELSVDAASEGVQTDTAQGANQRPNAASVYAVVRLLLC